MNTKLKTTFLAIFVVAMLVMTTSTVLGAEFVLSGTPTNAIEIYTGESKSFSFTLENGLDSAVSEITYSTNAISGITKDINGVTNLASGGSPGSSAAINVTINASSSADPGDKTLTFTIEGKTVPGSEVVKSTFDVTLKVREYFCDEGEQGNYIYSLTIDEPDNGDDFTPGEEVQVEFNVESNEDNLEFTVEVQLYDLTDGEILDEDEISDELDDGDDMDYSLTLQIPTDVDDSHEIIIRAKVYEDGNEDDQCKEEEVSIDISRDKHALSFEKVFFSLDTVGCGEQVDLTVKIANVGKNDEEDVEIKVENSQLNTLLKKVVDIDKGDSETYTFPLLIPDKILEGDYPVKVTVYYDDGDEQIYRTMTLKVQGNCLPPEELDVSLTASPEGEVIAGRSATFKVAISNTGNTKTTYTISASDYESWAILSSISPESVETDVGEIDYVYVTLDISNLASGTQTFVIKATYGDEASNAETKTATINVDVLEKSESATGWEQFLFEVKRNYIWLIVNVILVVAIVVLIIYLVSQKRKHGLPREFRFKKKK